MKQELPSEKIEELRAAFELFDKNGDGTISATELAEVMKQMNQNPTQQEINDMIGEVDEDGNGTIEFEEFVTMMTRHQSSTKEEDDLAMSFKMFDKNGDGSISKDELREVMASLGENLSEKEIDDMLAEADVNNDNVISFEEFKNMMSQTGR
ncbi:calmodulin 3 [Coemansia mojavensis]|nr:calmodulin 3 [Coemansia mojavensis]